MGVCGMDDEQATRAVQHYRERYAEEGMLEADIYPGMAKLLKSLGEGGSDLRSRVSSKWKRSYGKRWPILD